MSKTDKDIIRNISSYEMSGKRITEAVIAKIEKRETRLLWTRLVIYALSMTGTIVAMFPTVSYMSKEAEQTGFSSYLSLILSDGSYIFSHLKIFILSIGNSIPLTPIAITTTIILVFILSLGQMIRSFSSFSSLRNDYQGGSA